jgi:cation-transporting ATPase 13A3/4/5
MILPVSTQTYSCPLSTVFSTSSNDSTYSEVDEDNDPILSYLRFIDYRYLRFAYNPLEDKFQPVSGWKDSAWMNTKLMRMGLDVDERDSRELVFGQNIIDVHQKSMFELLIDEVSVPMVFFSEEQI